MAKGRLRATVCKHGHAIEGDNIFVVVTKGITYQRCRECYQYKSRGRNTLGRKKQPQPMCGSGQHKMTPENVYVSTRGIRHCRQCGRARRRVRRHEEQLGIKRPLIRAMTYDERLAHFSTRMPNGCLRWKGPLSAGRPKLYFKGLGGHGQKQVRTVVWERKTGRELSPCDAIKSTCNDDLCIEGEHLLRVNRQELMHTDAAKRKQAHTFRGTMGRQGRDFLVGASAHIAYVRKRLRARFRTQSEANIEDAIQSALLRMHIRVKQELAVIQNVRHYFTHSALRIMMDQIRSMYSRCSVSLDGVNEEEDDGQVERHAVVYSLNLEYVADNDPAKMLEQMEDEHERMVVARRHLRLAPPRMRRALLLHANGLAQKEIGRIMGITENTVEQLLTRGRKAMRGETDEPPLALTGT